MTDEKRIARLANPVGVSDVVMDTDTYNEIDDQFALSYLMRSPERVNLIDVYAAPFHNAKSTSPADGMEKSYDEIMKLLTLAGREDLKANVFKGSDRYLGNETTSVESDAARRLVSLAMSYTDDKPLYVVATGCITNVASAILMEPAIIEKIVLVWLGGHSFDWPDTKEFNLWQDVAAARVVFGCGVPMVMFPCMGVVSSFTTTGPELIEWLGGKNDLADYLAKNTIAEAESYAAGRVWSRVIWDATAAGWMIGNWCLSRWEPSPIPTYDGYFAHDPTRHLIKYVYGIDRDGMMNDMFQKLAK